VTEEDQLQFEMLKRWTPSASFAASSGSRDPLRSRRSRESKMSRDSKLSMQSLPRINEHEEFHSPRLPTIPEEPEAEASMVPASTLETPEVNVPASQFPMVERTAYRQIERLDSFAFKLLSKIQERYDANDGAFPLSEMLKNCSRGIAAKVFYNVLLLSTHKFVGCELSFSL